MDQPLIRSANLADAEEIASCMDAAYSRYVGQIPDMPRVSEGIAHEITHNQVWVAVQKNEITACLVLAPRSGFMKLVNVAVHPNQGGQGIGRKLIKHAEREAVRQGFDQLQLNTHSAMPRSIAFYKKMGWEEQGRKGNTVAMIRHV